MNHFVFAIASGMICGIAGARYASRLRKTASDLKRWETLLRYLAQLLSESTHAIPEVLSFAANEDTECDRLLNALSCGMKKEPLLPIPEQMRRLNYQGPGKDVLYRMAERLGQGSLESRCLAVGQAADEMQLLYQAAKTTSDKDSRMWSSLGWAAGACVTLLLL